MDISPVTRKEHFLARAAGDEDALELQPVTREEHLLQNIIDAIEQGGGGGGSASVQIEKFIIGGMGMVAQKRWRGVNGSQVSWEQLKTAVMNGTAVFVSENGARLITKFTEGDPNDHVSFTETEVIVVSDYEEWNIVTNVTRFYSDGSFGTETRTCIVPMPQ